MPVLLKTTYNFYSLNTESDIVPLIVTFFACLFLNMELGYLAITPDRSLIFTCMDYFISIVKKACANHPGVPIVIDLQHSSIADFSTAFVILITKVKFH